MTRPRRTSSKFQIGRKEIGTVSFAIRAAPSTVLGQLLMKPVRHLHKVLAAKEAEAIGEIS